jgi:GNAT superfamily N-acetyltransferase
VARGRFGELYLEAHCERLEHLARCRAAEARVEAGLLAVRTGVLSNTENGVVASRLDPSRADAVIRELLGWFQEAGAPAAWICDERVEPPDLRERLLRHGCESEDSAVAMGAELALVRLGDPSPPDGVRLLPVRQQSELDEWLAVADACGWFENRADRAAQRRLYLGLGLEQERPLRHWVARRGREPVAMASAFFGRGLAVLEHLAVVEPERCRGIGTALAQARLQEARRRGCRAVVLAPSPDGEKLYASLGFTAAAQPAGRWFYLPLRPPGPADG